MQIREVMTEDVDLIDPQTTIAEATQRMRNENFGALPVGEGDQLVGLVTDRDIVVRGIAEGKNPKTASVREVMSEKVYYCFEEQSVEEVADNMGGQQIRRLPVVNNDKRLVGIVSLGDLSAGGANKEAGIALGLISETAH